MLEQWFSFFAWSWCKFRISRGSFETLRNLLDQRSGALLGPREPLGFCLPSMNLIFGDVDVDMQGYANSINSA